MKPAPLTTTDVFTKMSSLYWETPDNDLKSATNVMEILGIIYHLTSLQREWGIISLIKFLIKLCCR